MYFQLVSISYRPESVLCLQPSQGVASILRTSRKAILVLTASQGGALLSRRPQQARILYSFISLQPSTDLCGTPHSEYDSQWFPLFGHLQARLLFK